MPGFPIYEVAIQGFVVGNPRVSSPSWEGEGKGEGGTKIMASAGSSE